MPKIVTLTPNPAVDLSTAVEQVVPSLKLRCAQPRRDPGGGGVNVARVIKRLRRRYRSHSSRGRLYGRTPATASRKRRHFELLD